MTGRDNVLLWGDSVTRVYAHALRNMAGRAIFPLGINSVDVGRKEGGRVIGLIGAIRWCGNAQSKMLIGLYRSLSANLKWYLQF